MIQSLSYENMSSTIPTNTGIWCFISKFLVVIVLFTTIIYFIHKKQFHMKISIFNLPPMKYVVNLIFQFKLLNSILLSLLSGETIKFAFKITRDSLKNTYYKIIMDDGIKFLEMGNTLSKTLKQMKVINPITIATISVGEETNSLEKALEKCLKTNVTQIENVTKKISILVEPLLMLLLGVFITYFMVNIFTPLLNMMDSI
jgi:type IV pilus assembly protein PilC